MLCDQVAQPTLLLTTKQGFLENRKEPAATAVHCAFNPAAGFQAQTESDQHVTSAIHGEAFMWGNATILLQDAVSCDARYRVCQVQTYCFAR